MMKSEETRSAKEEGMLSRAIGLAARAHEGAVRKGSKVPYIVHPMEVAAIVATVTDDEEIIAGAVLHDVVEDAGVTVEELRKEFGERVARLVDAESEDKRVERPSDETWKVRKQETVDFLRNEASREEKMIALGDKLSNMRAIFRDWREMGDKVWERFAMKDRREHEWYYREILRALEGEFGESEAWKEYQWLVGEVWG